MSARLTPFRPRLGRWALAALLALAAVPALAQSKAAEPNLGQPPPSPAHVPEGVAIKELICLPIAAALGAALAFRPQRRGTPPRSPAVIHTQIILAIVGALVMLVVGASLARAFGIVGAASLVRYRSKIDDPKDAGVMLSCLAIGLASGVGIYWVAAISTAFVWGVVWILESQEPESKKDFLLKIKAKEPAELQTGVEGLLRRNGVQHELRSSSNEDLTFWVRLPVSKKTDRLTESILALSSQDEVGVEWADKKPKDGG
jgi:uncharacterized membrane protein YhiD involved in acid resistance